jgi:hypothetical protein
MNRAFLQRLKEMQTQAAKLLCLTTVPNDRNAAMLAGAS